MVFYIFCAFGGLCCASAVRNLFNSRRVYPPSLEEWLLVAGLCCFVAFVCLAMRPLLVLYG